jgi:multiple sugar transport system substrate-binding protein
MGFKKKRIWTGFLFAALVLTACGTQSAPSDTPTVPASGALNFRITWTDYSGRGEAISKIVDAYNASSDAGAAVTMIGGDEDADAIRQLLESDSNTILVLPYRYVKYFGEAGLLADLTASFQDAQPLFYPEVWALGTYNGASYGVPWLGHSMCLLYNKTLLDEAGVDPTAITSREALLSAIETVEAKTSARGIGLVGADSNDVSWMVNQFIYGFGSSLVSGDGRTVTVNNARSKEALAFYKDILGAHAQPTWTEDTGVEVMDCFRKQEIAFEIQGIWGVTDIQKNGAPFEVGILSLSDVGLCAEVGPMMLALPAGMKDTDKEAAVRFIRYMISKPAQEQIMNGEYSPEHDTYYPFRTPIRVDMADSQIFKSNPDYVKFIDGFQNPSVDVPVPAWQTVKEEVYQPGLHRLMTGEITIDAFLGMVETEGNQILGS